MGAWNMAKPIPIPNRLHFAIRLIEGVVVVGRHQILEMRESKDTGNIFARFNANGKEFIGLLIN